MVALIHQRKYDLVKMKIVKHAGLELILRWCNGEIRADPKFYENK